MLDCPIGFDGFPIRPIGFDGLVAGLPDCPIESPLARLADWRPMRRYAAVEAVWTMSECNLGQNSVANPFQAARYQRVTMGDIM